MRLLLSLLLNTAAVLCAFWLVPWAARTFGSAVAARGEPVEFYCLEQSATAVPAVGKISVLCAGDDETRWEFFLSGEDSETMIRNWRPGSAVKLTGRVSLPGRMSGLNAENARFSLSPESTALRVSLVRAGFVLLCAGSAVFLVWRIRRPVIGGRRRRF